jgi:glycosyltransferase involved in cell wall biosynthesis
MREPSRVSIIIPTAGKLSFLKDVLSSLREGALGSSEILIVDNSRDDTSRYEPMLKKYSGLDLHVIQEPRNGLHFARHAGALAAKADILVYIDDDVVCPKGWLEKLVQPFQDSSVACVGGKTVGKFAEPPPGWVKDCPAYLSLLDLGPVERDIRFPEETLFGCNFAVRKQVLLDVGGFNPDGFSDPAFYWYRGDGETGLQRKFSAAKQRMVYAPDAWLYHQIPAERLQEEYLLKRVQNQAVSDGFSYYRTHTTFLTPLKGLALCLWLPARAALSSNAGRAQRCHGPEIRRQYWKFRLVYAWKAFTQPEFIRYTRSDNFWDKP